MSMEIWKIMKENNNYEISNLGKVRTIKTKRIRKTRISNKGYERIGIYINKKLKYFYIHRLVANNFMKNPNNYKEINHINENKLDNRLENLEYCDTKYNCNYGTRTERIIKTKEKTFKTIIQKDKNGNVIKKWKNIIEIKNNTNFNKHSIYKCCNGKHKTAYGYKWEYDKIKCNA